MSDLLDLVGETMTPSTLRDLGAQVGASPEQTGAAVNAALPMMLGALQRNSGSEQGAMSLLGALDRDHDGSILDDLGGFLGQGPSASGDRSLDHMFGGRRAPVENAVSRASGLNGSQVTQLLAMLAPLVLGMLGRARNQGGQSGQSGSGGLGDLLGGAMGKMQQQSPDLGGLLGGLLDSDGDGSVMDDLLEKGLGGGGSAASGGGLGDLGGLLGGLLGGKR